MTGEFFGVKSALGKFPRDETALVMQNSDILVFSLVEFEQLVLKNTRIIMKMLRVFSNQLRRIHHQVKNTISQGKVLPPEEGLFKIGEYYFKNGLFSQALYTYQRYITYYPSGDFATEANGRIPECERLISSGAQRAPSVSVTPSPKAEAPKPSGAAGGGSKFYEALGMIGKENYAGALKVLQEIISQGEGAENLAKAEMEYGKTLVSLGRQDDGIKFITGVIQKYPKHPDMTDGLFFMGKAYAAKNEADKAKSFFQKVLGMSDESDAIAVKTRKALRALEGADA
jgi:TolA-binding protein